MSVCEMGWHVTNYHLIKLEMVSTETIAACDFYATSVNIFIGVQGIDYKRILYNTNPIHNHQFYSYMSPYLSKKIFYPAARTLYALVDKNMA